MPPLHILQVVRPSAGGIRTHVRLLAGGLIDRGHQVSVAAPSDFALTAPNVPHVIAPIVGRPSPLQDLRAAVIVSKSACSSDLIHGHGLRGAWIAALASRLGGKTFVFTAHNQVPATPGPLARVSLRFVVRRSAAAICVSRAIADGLRLHAPPGARIEVVPNGLNVPTFDGRVDRASVANAQRLPPPTLAPEARWVVSVGRLSPEKGFETLVRIAAELQNDEPLVYFVVAGEGPERAALERHVEVNFLRERLFLPGYVSDVPALLRAADAVVIPSLQEGQGIVALEAMAARTPVVASRVGGLVETVGDAGVLVPPNDTAAFSKALREMLSDEAQRQRLAVAGRRRVEENYTLDRMLKSTITIYQSVIG
jgi:glycosyltransferase involved in cell wall biosynthesis